MQTTTIDGELFKHYDLEQIYKDALYDQLELSEIFEQYLLAKYSISKDSPFLIIGMWLGETYQEEHLRVQSSLENYDGGITEPNKRVICLPLQKLVLCILHPMTERKTYHYFQQKIQNEWCLFSPESSIFIAQRCTGLADMATVLPTLLPQLHWNLVLGSRILIYPDKIKTLHITPFIYPTELDGLVETALLHRDIPALRDAFVKLWNISRHEVHTPDVLKSACTRFAILTAHIFSIHDKKRNEVALEEMLKALLASVYWAEIWHIILEFTVEMLKENEDEKEQSLLIIEAKKIMQYHYSSGITLEETADRLHVTEEYLSTVFKKETGITFSETIRSYRINKVKDLLVSSRLKIHDIAQAAGYSDGKYMSRVFREMVGMSPNEYRKARAD